MTKRRALSALLSTFGASLALSLASCSSAGEPEEPVQLTFWTTTAQAQTTFFRNRIGAFMEEHPGIEVRVEQHEFPFATNEFKTAVLGDQTVDVFRADNSWVPEYADLDILYPLDELAPASRWSGFTAFAIEPLLHEGRLYGLPSVLEVPALLYNKRLLSEAGYPSPPATMDELLAMAKKLTGGGRYGLFVTEDSYFALPYLWAFGGGMLTDEGKIEIASDNSRRALAFMVRLRQEGVTQPYSDFTDWYSRMVGDFTSGRSAMMMNGPWAIGDIQSTGGQFRNNDYLGIAPMPKGPGGQGSPVGGHSLVINKYSKHPKESMELIAYLTDSETQVRQSLAFKTLPTQSAAYADARLAKDRIVQGFVKQLAAAKAVPSIPEGAKLFMDFTNHLNAMLLGKETVDVGTRKIEEAWKALLD
ncbi:extracellular solute-binding protein [Paenibacillus methanolicus]|uniref:Arabinogalactan oligomer/maltooligosaccharide transport system substrate-binding protein n=1 Tax=Paenibacillus methanolicus TaxID=582686 RepID=A0A5S5CI49_9BACL|nr:extracellular solute-binding protein [Paenibacillus methanolicus]TYP78182.1 arabinogalactan oligomer/maltooligosaccharide transport system substrate-binding protein [Paenibacillus methanolicus]